MATSTHNKYVSIPDWFSSSSSTPITSTEKPANITNVYYGGGSGGGTTGITEIPIDNKTIVWQDQVITVPIDNDKIIINTEGKITTSGTTGVWELRQLTDGTNYIYTTYPVVTQLGITMYAGTDGLDLGSIYDGLPIDNATIYWDLDENGNKILKAVGSSGGVADSVAWVNVTGKPDWLLDGKIQYTEIEGIPDLSGFITKDYIDGKFVTFDLNETIDGIKTFTNGIKIGNSLINQSQNDVIYIDANLVVRGGITMYATGTVDIPSILDSLPVAGTDSKGIASFDSSYFSVTNGKVTLLADNVGLNESELAEYLNTNNYAKKSDIPSLNGYATQSWVESKGYALNSDLMLLTTKVDDFLEGSDTDTIINKWSELEAFLSGLSESDNLATILSAKADKDYVDDTFVTLTTTQTITGEKNFTGGLKVNGSPIVYDATKKYWKLEGDLLVTGGVTMYGSDSSFTPSTIMDAIAVDGTTISKSGGVLKVIGGTGGGVADSVAWANITGKPTFATVATSGKYSDLSGTPSSLPASDVYSWAKSATKPTYTWSEITSKPTWIGSSKPTYSYSEITGAISTTELQNYLTQNSYLNVTSGDNRYLQLSGGTINNNSTFAPLIINTSYSELDRSSIVFRNKNDNKGQIGWDYTYGTFLYNYLSNTFFGVKDNGTPYINDYTIWHSGNDGSGSGLNADLLDGYHSDDFTKTRISNIDNFLNFTDRVRFQTAYISGKGDFCSLVIPTWSSNSSSNWYLTEVRFANEGLPKLRLSHNGTVITDWREFAFTDSNVASASQVMINYSYNQDVNYPLVFTSRDNIGSSKNGSMYIDFSGRPTYNPKSDTLTVGNLLGNASSANVLVKSYTENINYSTYHSALKLIYNTQNDNYGFPNLYVSGLSVMAGYTGWQLMSYGGDVENPYFRSLQDTGTWKPWRQIAFLTDNVASATRLQTTRTIWGQSFDGSSNVDGDFTQTKGGSYGGPYGGQNFYIYNKVTSDVPERYGVLRWAFDDHAVFRRLDIISKDFDVTNTIISFLHNGNVGIGTTSTSAKLHVSGDILATGGITMYSMRKLKNVVDERGLSLNELSTIKPTRYTWKDGRDNRLHFGGIADDIQQVLPEVVYSTSDGILTMDYGNAAFAVASSLIQPVVDHEKRIAMLQERIDELEEEVERLKAS